ncbi:VPS28 protein-domain-containing protein [Lophiotrema nucula]|uniref:VPS28 protein-domain-containing protein n=1 Tax=Lophiotrema nucula TaxID=690887 RepID=A0A6A5YYB2_9PLEO|nr:VPS28 protein-domain-containing protein [Lophiotrema nucula]
MYAARQQAYAPTPYIPRSSLSATINLDEEVKLSTTSTERDLYDSLAEIYSIIVTLDALEKAYLKDSINEGDYTEACSRLLKQYKSNLADETVARTFGDLESFKREWDLECPRATERLRVGIPATVEQGTSHKPSQQGGDNRDATLVISATENFITLLDAIKIGLVEKDTLHPFLVEIIQAVNKVTDVDFESKGKIVQWLITLNQMRAAEKLNDDQVRDFQFDMEQAYHGDLRLQDGGNDEAERVQVDPEGVTDYLTRIVGSGLQWIDDDEAREQIWSQASIRLSERSGRTAMGAISREFTIPSATGSFQLLIHEPALTGDDLGLKTWAASYLLAKRLHNLSVMKSAISSKARVLELGSGTGLVGLAAAGLGADVVLTDLPSIHQNLARNVHANIETVYMQNGSVYSGILDWSDPTSSRVFPASKTIPDDEGDLLGGNFSLILAADSLYSPEHPEMLVNAIAIWLSEDDDAAVVVEFPLRDAYLPEVADFRERMKSNGLAILEEGKETGYDDWGEKGTDDDSGRALVTCWWSIWGRTVPAQ